MEWNHVRQIDPIKMRNAVATMKNVIYEPFFA